MHMLAAVHTESVENVLSKDDEVSIEDDRSPVI